MRAYFNYQALSQGRDFSLPSDAGYLNCVPLSSFSSSSSQQEQQGDDDGVEEEQGMDEEDNNENNGEGEDDDVNNNQLYAKIGCMERETFTSTRLQLHLYTDAQCSEPYDDGLEGRTHSNKGYEIDGEMFSTRVSFRPPFFTCQSCSPDVISETFNKKYGTWYDDDYISEHGQKRGEDNDPEDQGGDDGINGDDASSSSSYYKDDGYVDDTYMSANDDLGQYNNGNPYNNYNNNRQKYNYDQYTQNINKQYYYTDDYNNNNNNARQNYYNNKYNNNNNGGGRGRDLRDLVRNEGDLRGHTDHYIERQLVPVAGELEVSLF